MIKIEKQMNITDIIYKTGIAYYRYSSGNQHEESIEAQMECVRKYAKENNITIIKEYIDREETAATDERTHFQEMVADVKAGRVKPDFLIVDKFDRYCRDIKDHFVYKFFFEDNDIKTIAVLEPTYDNLLVEAIIAAKNHDYIRNLSNEVSRKMLQYAKKALHLGGVPLLGYDVYEVMEDGRVRKRYKINEKEGPAVQLGFKLFKKGYSLKKTAQTLNSFGYKTKKGRPFTASAVYEMLTNEKYKGTYVYNRTVSKKKGKRNHHKSKPDDEVIRIPDALPRLVSDEDFDAVQERLHRIKRAPGANKAVEPYLLTGLIFCGECQGHMVGHRKIAGREKKYYYSYECNNRIRLKNCSAKAVNKHYVEKEVIDRLLKDVFSPKSMEKLMQKLEEIHEQRERDNRRGIEQATEELRSIETKLGNYLKAIEDGLYSPTMKKNIAELESRKELLTNAIQAAATKRKALDKKTIKAYLLAQKEILLGNDLERIKNTLSQFVKKVIVYNDSLDVKIIVDIDGGGGALLLKSTIDISDQRGSIIYMNTGTVLGIKIDKRVRKK